MKAERRTLELLAFFLKHPQKELPEFEIAESIWKNDSAAQGNIEQQVYRLRIALGEKAKTPRFIETISGFGYKFLEVPVTGSDPEQHTTNDAGRVRITELWEHETFIRFLAETKRGAGPDEEGDLRIRTTAFSSGVPDVFTDLLDRNIRIQILFLNEAIIRSRNLVRQEHSPEKALRHLREQTDTLDTMDKRKGSGSLEVLFSDVMPSGFVAHSSHGALFGILLSTESYVRGPMIEIGPNTRLWEILRKDWKHVWERAKDKDNEKRRARN